MAAASIVFLMVFAAGVLAIAVGIPYATQRHARRAPAPGARRLILYVVSHALAFGAAGFLIGFVGPLVFAPDANQGPLLGIFITGPGALILGMAVGTWRSFRP